MNEVEKSNTGVGLPKVATIIHVNSREGEHWHEDTAMFPSVTFRIRDTTIVASSVLNRTLHLDETMLFLSDGEAVQDWDGRVIGPADMDVPHWLEEQGYIVQWDLTTDPALDA